MDDIQTTLKEDRVILQMETTIESLSCAFCHYLPYEKYSVSIGMGFIKTDGKSLKRAGKFELISCMGRNVVRAFDHSEIAPLLSWLAMHYPGSKVEILITESHIVFACNQITARAPVLMQDLMEEQP